jgi:hypothetical protein
MKGGAERAPMQVLVLLLLKLFRNTSAKGGTRRETVL